MKKKFFMKKKQNNLYKQYCIKNRTDRIQHLTVQLDSTDVFMFAGCKLSSLTLLRKEVARIKTLLRAEC